MFEQQLIDAVGRSNAELMRTVIEPAAMRQASIDRELDRDQLETTRPAAHRLGRPRFRLGAFVSRLHVHRKTGNLSQSNSPR